MAVSSEEFFFMDHHQAAHFAGLLESCLPNQKPELLQLISMAEFGSARLKDALEFCPSENNVASVAIVENVAVKIISFVCDPSLDKPIFAIASSKLVLCIYNRLPQLMEIFSTHLDAMSEPSTGIICRFLVKVCRLLLEARASPTMKRLSDQITSITGDAGARTLSNLIYIIEYDGQGQRTGGSGGNGIILPSERRLPHGRHGNDFTDFRQIAIEPTIDELNEASPYLPLGEANRFLVSELSHVLDKNFRLLREDFLRPTRERLGQNIKILSGLSLSGVDFGGGPGMPSLIFELTSTSKEMANFLKSADESSSSGNGAGGGKPASYHKKKWEYPGLEGDSLVCLVLADEPVLCGKVVPRASGNEWLSHSNGPRVGIVFGAENERAYKELEGLLKHMGTKTTFDLISISRNFFSYASVLRRLQEIETLPFDQELLFGQPNQVMPAILPHPSQVQLQIAGFSHSPVVDISTELSAEDEVEKVISETSLDRWQAEALLRSLRSPVAILQGPPGTGKSFIGASLAKTTSKSNKHEADMAVAICKYLLQQDQFKPNEVVILTPYLGQVRLLAQRMHSQLKDVTAILSEQDRLELENGDPVGANLEEDASSPAAQSDGVRVSSVDNFQGEESKVVIISLVRSNEYGSIGFLNQHQPVNVLLSRAKNGMYILGNRSTLTRRPKGERAWGPIMARLSGENRIVGGIPARCQVHTENMIELCEPLSFEELRPNGGCELLCRERMECGHNCDLFCHGGYDPEHKFLKCTKDCSRFPKGCSKEHRCPKRCFEACGSCQEPMEVELPDCGHSKKVPCAVNDSVAKLTLEKCNKMVTFQLSCDHEMRVTCSDSRDPEKSRLFQCKVICENPLPCSHSCNKRCHRASEPDCGPCTNPCSAELRCGHVGCSRGVCHADDPGTLCLSCTNPCVISCDHSKCSKPCSDVCSPCLEKCEWECKHQGRCESLCGCPCSRLPCDERCEELLVCGCRCPSLCGETFPPPDWCQGCGVKGNEIVDMIMLTKYEDVDLNEEPLIVLECGHSFLVSTLDGLFELESVYSGHDTRAKKWGDARPFSSSQSDVAQGQKRCPSCRSILRGINRYGRVSKLSDLNVLEGRFVRDYSEIMAAAKARRSQGNIKEAYSQLRNLMKRYTKKNPKRVVYEASGGASAIDIKGASKPFTQPLVEVIKELLLAAEELIRKSAAEDEGDKILRGVEESVLFGIKICDDQNFFASGASIRCQSVRCLLARHPTDRAIRAFDEVDGYLKWVLDSPNPSVSLEIRKVATLLQKQFASAGLSENEKEEIMAAMSSGPSGDHSGQHWYACDNGHRYYIGNCGMVNQTATCPECGCRIGAQSSTVRVNSL